jgi:hypothetical protein
MAHLQFTDVQARPTEFLDLTSLTLDEFPQLVLPFEAAFQAHMAAWRLHGKPPHRPPVCRLQELPFTNARRSPVLHPHVPEDLQPPSGPGTLIWDGPEQSESVDPRALARAAGRSADPRRCADSLPGCSGPTARRGRSRRRLCRHSAGGGASPRRRRPNRWAGLPPINQWC